MFFKACMCFTVRDKVVPRPRPRRIYANLTVLNLLYFKDNNNALYLTILSEKIQWQCNIKNVGKITNNNRNNM